MKNKELAKMWKESQTDKTLRAIIQDFFDMIPRLSKERNLAKNKNPAVLVSIIDEVLNKWKQLCKNCEGLKPDGFEELLSRHTPEVISHYRLYKAREARR